MRDENVDRVFEYMNEKRQIVEADGRYVTEDCYPVSFSRGGRVEIRLSDDSDDLVSRVIADILMPEEMVELKTDRGISYVIPYVLSDYEVVDETIAVVGLYHQLRKSSVVQNLEKSVKGGIEALKEYAIHVGVEEGPLMAGFDDDSSGEEKK